MKRLLFRSLASILVAGLLAAGAAAQDKTPETSRKLWPQEPTAFQLLPWVTREAESLKLLHEHFNDVTCVDAPATDTRSGKERVCGARFSLGSVVLRSFLT